MPPVRAFVEGAQTTRLGRVEDDEPAAASQPMIVTGEPAVELIGVHKQFGDKPVLRGIDLKIYPGIITVLIGASGSGKSVIIKHILGLFKPDQGQVNVFGEDIVPLDARGLQRVRTRIGLLFQHGALLDWLTVAGNVAFPLEEHHAVAKARSATACARCWGGCTSPRSPTACPARSPSVRRSGSGWRAPSSPGPTS
jgi:ABC-type multidrug transport system fused ATPase/permease subunit